MAWEKRSCHKRYYYRSIRNGNKVTKQYCGTGQHGRLAQDLDILRRINDQESKEAFAAIEGEANAICKKLDTLGNILDRWLWAELLALGWQFRKSQWRQPH